MTDLSGVITGDLYTAVSGTISVAHDSPEGARHGHDYHVKAWYRFGSDARILLAHLDAVLDTLDHQVLPKEIGLGERLAAHIGVNLPGTIKVEIERQTRRGGIYALWVRRDSDATRQGGDAKAAPVPKHSQARAESIAQPSGPHKGNSQYERH